MQTRLHWLPLLGLTLGAWAAWHGLTFQSRPNFSRQLNPSAAPRQLLAPPPVRSALSKEPFNATTAAAHLLALPAEERLVRTTQLLSAWLDQPDEALRLARLLNAQDPALIREHGSVFIGLFTANHDFVSAVLFAEHGGPERPLWLTQIFATWANENPALAAYVSLTQLDGEGFLQIISTWATRDPAALNRFAQTLPDGPPRTAALDLIQPSQPTPSS